MQQQQQPARVRPDLVKFNFFSKILKDFGNYWRAYLDLGKNFEHTLAKWCMLLGKALLV